MAHFVTSKDIPADGEHIDKSKLAKPMMIFGGLAFVGLILSVYLLFFAGSYQEQSPSEAAAFITKPVADAPGGDIRGNYAYSWLFAFAYFVTLSFGGCFWLILHHVSNSGWGVSIRRLMENLATVFPWMAIIAIPFFFPQVQSKLFEWMNIHRETGFNYAAAKDAIGGGIFGSYAKDGLHASHDPHDHLLYVKYFYVNLNWWYVRMALYFVGLGGFVIWLKNKSVKQDTDDNPSAKSTLQLRYWAPAGLIMFGLSISFIAFDLLMALDYTWFSTMWGVCYFAGSVLNSMAVLILVLTWLRSKGYLKTVTSAEHYHIMGKLMFAFIVFWAYVNFSQFFLIWYANITEETRYFLLRNTEGWNVANIILVFGHFAVPFVFMLPHYMKRKPALACIFASYMLILHILDMYIIVIPERAPSLSTMNGFEPTLWFSGAFWGDILAFVTVGSFFMFILLRNLGKQSLYPNRDARILESANVSN
ncbi:hypothetical protein [Persicirhabdus sediminis]|uniref:Quinol:cytochrome c oxidoreductase quinone-binding subunit 2 n=1 Tax=Persicirhabdus sediminis TaxID=454144 RepID=A0A8J7MD74_9BACT|nr:hypothetical protein [Persicirhabdus sediminis]MBK1790400.1 hypothetical protein [Persicirhabdus sediminis]